MISKKNSAPLWGIILATTFAPLVTAIVCGIWRGIPSPLIVLTLIVLLVGFYLLGFWCSVRPYELNKKIPISSTERARRRKEFYDWVNSLGRR
jgi:hypothetical protein